MAQSSTSSYLRALKSRLPSDVYQPARSRLWWLPVHCSVIAGGSIALSFGIPLLFRLVVSVLIGASFAGLAFVGHEALHGALTRNKRLRRVAGFLGFMPFCVSPRLWIAWHNRVHHGATNHPDKDPDADPTMGSYRSSQAVRIVTQLQRKSRGLLTLLLGFTGQSAHMLVVARARGYLNARHHRLAILETGIAMGIWTSLGFALGWGSFMYAYVLPLLLANVIVMAHILTNHGLNPLDHDNDPLKSSLSVSVPRWFRWYTLGFGYHVEHHLMPAMSHRHGPTVQRALRDLYPHRYQCMPLGRALWSVCIAPRVYGDAATLIDPDTGARYQTLGSRPFADANRSIQSRSCVSSVPVARASQPAPASHPPLA